MYAVTAAEFTAEGTANFLINRCIPLWGCPRSILSDNGLQFCSKLSQAVYKLLGVRKIAISSYHPDGNSGMERVNHTMAQMLAMVVNELQNDWNVELPHVEFAYNNSVSAATGLAPDEVHMGSLPRLPLTIFERTGVFGHQSLARDHLAYCDLATDRQQRAYDIIRAHHALTVCRVERRNSALSDALRAVPKFVVDGWVWVYNTAATIRQGAKTDTDAKVLKAKLSINWTGPYKVLAVGPCTPADTPDGSPLGDKLLYLHLPSRHAWRGCSPARYGATLQALCQPLRPRRHAQEFSSGIGAIRVQQLLQESPPYHVTQDDVSTPLRRLEVEKITGHQSVRGRGRVITVMYETHWTGLSGPSWEREMDLQLFRHEILRYWAGTPNQHRQTNRLYRRMRIGAAQRELSRNNGERFLAHGYGCVPRSEWLSRYSTTVLPNGAHFRYKGNDGFT